MSKNMINPHPGMLICRVDDPDTFIDILFVVSYHHHGRCSVGGISSRYGINWEYRIITDFDFVILD